ncbi:MAG TPA: SlyX protein [Candidatus Anaerobiospirillum pullistercoris]|uniref:SlyX protein n=1 Tax=Candidatus Anaerobiospirillum pullistercoris TaxID=2838452 RepID=A0A9D1WEQ9_9GAMM|nr:SlyX protein [Candidatus Anaerobiospirillum pullistercoris]
MQERIAWLEANLGDTTNLIEELFTKIDKMERQIRYLASISEAPSAVRPLSEETPPPHY